MLKHSLEKTPVFQKNYTAKGGTADSGFWTRGRK